MKLIRRFKARIVRWNKSRFFNWSERWQEACDSLWAKFNSKPPSREAFEWMERNHARLMSQYEKRMTQRRG